MQAPQVAQPVMSAKEYGERRYIQKVLSATANYCRAKLAGYPVDIQCEGYPHARPTVWRMTLVVQFVEQPPPMKIVPSFDVQGRL
jgi:hypothetical protein